MNHPAPTSPHLKKHHGRYAAKIFRFFNKHGISRRKLKKNKWVQIIGHKILSRELWIFERDSLAKAWLIGALVATSPFFGIHLILALALLVAFRANVPLGLILVFVTNPITIIPFYTFAYLLGRQIIPNYTHHHLHLKTMIHDGFWALLNSHGVTWMDFLNFILTLTLGCLVTGTVVGFAGYGLIKFFIKPSASLTHHPKPTTH